MNMLRHHYVPHHYQLILGSYSLQCAQYRIASTGAEQWTPVMTTESDEMQVTRSVKSLEVLSHVRILFFFPRTPTQASLEWGTPCHAVTRFPLTTSYLYDTLVIAML